MTNLRNILTSTKKGLEPVFRNNKGREYMPIITEIIGKVDMVLIVYLNRD